MNFIIADFEWCITPISVGADKLAYFNEILSAGAVTVDENGMICNRFYSLIRPNYPRYVHPVMLEHLHLDRGELAGAPPFPSVFRRFQSYIGNRPIFTWGNADRSAFLQNVRFKSTEVDMESAVPPMRDIQTVLCRAAEMHSPYPSLANTLASLNIVRADVRHNALSDAEAVASIVRCLTESGRFRPQQLFHREERVNKPSVSPEHSIFPTPEQLISETVYNTAEEAFLAAKRMRRSCPICSSPIGVGVWMNNAPDEKVTLCNCERDGKLICSVKVIPTGDGAPYHILQTVSPYGGAVKNKYNAARHNKKHPTV